MRDPAEIYTKSGTPLVVIGSRLLFVAYFIFEIFAVESNLFPEATLSYSWIVYLMAIYYISERIYSFFNKKGIDLSFAFPLLLAMYVFNLLSMVVSAQESFPIVNRAEHFLSFVLLTYIVWVFFVKYLPQKVWRDHPYYTSILVLAVTSTLGVANEIVELFSDSLFNTSLIGNTLDTSLDLLMNSLGAVLFLSVKLIIGTIDKSPETF